MNKQDLERQIKIYQYKQTMEVKIREVIEEFKYFKQVNKRFIDALKAAGFWAYICKEHNTTVLSIRPADLPEGFNGNKLQIEIRLFDQELTWEKILIDLTRMNFVEAERHYKEKLSSFDDDLEKVKGLLNHIKTVKTNNFDLYRLKNKLEDLIRESA